MRTFESSIGNIKEYNTDHAESPSNIHEGRVYTGIFMLLNHRSKVAKYQAEIYRVQELDYYKSWIDFDLINPEGDRLAVKSEFQGSLWVPDRPDPLHCTIDAIQVPCIEGYFTAPSSNSVILPQFVERPLAA